MSARPRSLNPNPGSRRPTSGEPRRHFAGYRPRVSEMIAYVVSRLPFYPSHRDSHAGLIAPTAAATEAVARVLPSYCHPHASGPVPTRHYESEPVPMTLEVTGVRERVTGVEPATLCLASTRSSQLSYTRRAKLVTYHRVPSLASRAWTAAWCRRLTARSTAGAALAEAINADRAARATESTRRP